MRGLRKRPVRRVAQALLLAILGIALAPFAASSLSPQVAWRVRLLTEKLTGQIPQIPLAWLIKWSLPDSPVNLYRLSSTPIVNAAIVNGFDDRASGAAGERTFGRVCAGCHGDDARGEVAPDLIAAIGGLSDWQFLSTVKWGRRGTLMRPQPVSDLEIWQIEAFIRQTALDAAVGKQYSADPMAAYQPVTPEMLRAGAQGGDWLTYAGDSAGTRHSPLTGITPENVGSLRLAWAAQLPAGDGEGESTPIVVGPWMFVTEQPEGVTALDARTGSVLWQFHRPIPAGVHQCCGEPNRGVAVFGKDVYVSTFDAHLIALSAATGAELWDATVADWRQGYSLTSAPFVADGRVVVGVAGGDFGARGSISAYSASSGARLWRFDTVPAPGQPGNDTWAGDSWQHGGVAAWFNGAYDPVLGLIYFGTGNPEPAMLHGPRQGDDLYSNCLLALDVRTGRLRWYFQFTPGDDHAWDSAEQPILADIDRQGRRVPALLLANRNGFFYALDRRSGRFLFAKAFARQTWAAGFDANGRPIRLPNSDPTPNGTVVSPPAWGATSWWSPSFDPGRNLVFVPSVDSADLMFAAKEPDYSEGRPMIGSGIERALDQPTTLALRAIDASTGRIRWNAVIEQGGGEVPGQMGGVLTTAGGVVFAGHASEFDAYDADSGAELWRTPLGGSIHAAPMSYAMAGRQYVAVISGRALFVFSLPPAEASPKRSSPDLRTEASR